MKEEDLEALWKAIEGALPDDANVCRMFEAAKQGFAHLDKECGCVHLRRLHLAYWWVMRLHPLFYAIDLGCTTPAVMLAMPSNGMSMKYIEMVGGVVFDQRQGSVFALVEGGRFVEFSKQIGDRDAYTMIEATKESSVHVIAYADNMEDFSHRPMKPIYDFGIEA